MFIVKKEHEYEWPVDVKVPSDKLPGHYDVQRFFARFRALPTSEAQALREALDALPEDERRAQAHDLLHRVMVGWREIQGEDGQPLPYSAEALDQACEVPYVAVALYEAYGASITGAGREQRRRGN